MFPYVAEPAVTVGGYTLHAFPVLVGLAIVAVLRIVMWRARDAGIPAHKSSTLILWAIATGLVGAHVFDVVFYFPEKLRQDPLELLRIWGGLSSFGGILFGLLGLLAAMWRVGLSREEMLRFADCVLFALPFTLAIGRAGCALQHDHLGVSSNHWLAVRFPDGPRFDLGLLECLYMVAVSGLFLGLRRRPWPAGFFVGLFFVLYGPVRFAFDGLRIGDARYDGWTPAQYLSVAATLLGVAVLAWALSRPDAVASGAGAAGPGEPEGQPAE